MTRKTIIRTLDKLWSDRIRKRDGNCCRKCGKKHNLDPHHIFSRRHLATRWDLRNGILLCRGHHRLFHGAMYASTLATLQAFHVGVRWEDLDMLFKNHRKIFKPTREWLENKIKELEEA